PRGRPPLRRRERSDPGRVRAARLTSMRAPLPQPKRPQFLRLDTFVGLAFQLRPFFLPWHVASLAPEMTVRTSALARSSYAISKPESTNAQASRGWPARI